MASCSPRVGWCVSGPLATTPHEIAAAGQTSESHGAGRGFGDVGNSQTVTLLNHRERARMGVGKPSCVDHKLIGRETRNPLSRRDEGPAIGLLSVKAGHLPQSFREIDPSGSDGGETQCVLTDTSRREINRVCVIENRPPNTGTTCSAPHHEWRETTRNRQESGKRQSIEGIDHGHINDRFIPNVVVSQRPVGLKEVACIEQKLIRRKIPKSSLILLLDVLDLITAVNVKGNDAASQRS